MSILTFKYDLRLDHTLEFESVYPEPLQLNLDEKTEIRDSKGSIFVWMFADSELVGESYGVPLMSDGEEFEGLTGLMEADKKQSIYCYSNTILPAFQRKGLGSILKAHWLGWAVAQDFAVVYGHARPGGSQGLNAKFGAVFIGDFPNWYGTGEDYKLYCLALR